ncbi:MAG: glucose-1-phosphate adenylyltransferase [Gammaproteobacteria bacterium]|nr:glucose-1-phosphate adenylyltransferase [Gammaproteobacteria bacterium]MDH4311345.1 glucose-1-phosphate adenylyltransferase [Gammaproteobacteria bacterium]MDH5273924.1 glucose-1-phosphate adenylyltransferase [Gammaproteobacteria bacterium]
MSTEQQRVGAPRRYLSRLTRGTLAVIMAGGRGERLKQLTEDRCKPATPFGGKFRIIDFVLSNCLNSGIRQISVLTQYKAHSLIQHIGKGWGFLRGEFGEFIEIIPAQQRRGPEWYQGTADALWQNMELMRAHRPLHVLVLAGDHIYKMDYGPMIGFHVEKEADITVGVVEVPVERAREFGVLGVDESNRVLSFLEKPMNPPPIPGRPDVALGSMGIYVFNPRLLERLLRADAEDPGSAHDFGKNIIPQAIENLRVFAYPFEDVRSKAQHYWRDVGTVDAYYEANMELVRVSPELNIYDEQWPIWTYQEQLPPAKFVFDDADRRGCAIDSMVSGGCIISGSRVANSLLFSQVRVHDYSTVERSVILPRVHIGEHCVIRDAIIDSGVVVPDGTTIGVDPVQDRERFSVSENGVTLVTASMLRPAARGGGG